MDSNQLIWNYQEAIVRTYREQELTCLGGLDNSFLLNGRNILAWHLDVVQKAAQRNSQFQYNKNMDDIYFCSDELLFFTANLYLYRPYINSPLRDAIPIGDGAIYPNYQNLEGKRYNMFADITCQVAYNYWDRIGDLIASFFPGRIKSEKVFFSTAIDSVPEQFQGNEHFSWLKGFQEKGYRELNKKRRQVVHYATLDTDFKFRHLKSPQDKQAIESLQAARDALADFYKCHISLTLSGYEKTLMFLEDLSSRLFSDPS
jgi:hypothetical protein